MDRTQRTTEIINLQRDAILRFWASMNDLDYNEVVEQYWGGSDITRKLIMNELFTHVETALSFGLTENHNLPTRTLNK